MGSARDDGRRTARAHRADGSFVPGDRDGHHDLPVGVRVVDVAPECLADDLVRVRRTGAGNALPLGVVHRDSGWARRCAARSCRSGRARPGRSGGGTRSLRVPAGGSLRSRRAAPPRARAGRRAAGARPRRRRRSRRGSDSSREIEPVADPRQRRDGRPRRRGTFTQLAPQGGDVDVERLRRSVPVLVPHFVHDALARHRASDFRGQQHEQIELARPQRELTRPGPRPARGDVDFDVTGCQQLDGRLAPRAGAGVPGHEQAVLRAGTAW